MTTVPLQHSSAPRCFSSSLDGVTPCPVDWVWQDWIARGALSLMLGETGVGKSLVALDLVAMVTQGQKALLSAEQRQPAQDDVTTSTESLPEANSSAGGTVVLFGCGDSDDIVHRRLVGAGAVLDNVVLIDRRPPEDLADLDGLSAIEDLPRPRRKTAAQKDLELRMDLKALELQLKQLQSEGRDVRLVVIDPIESLLRDSLDKGRLAEQLSEMAARTGVAIVAVGIQNATPLGRTGFRLRMKGVNEFFRVARSVLAVVHDLDNEQFRLLLPLKLGLCAPHPGLRFEIHDPGELAWTDAEITLTGEQYLAQAKELLRNPLYKEARQDQERTTSWLKQRLNDGEALKTQVENEAYDQEIALPTLKRSFRLLGGIEFKFPSDGRWRSFWRLPQPATYKWVIPPGSLRPDLNVP